MCTINTDSVLNNINIKISKVTKSIGSGYCNYYNKYVVCTCETGLWNKVLSTFF